MKSIALLVAICFLLFIAEVSFAQGPGKGKRSGKRVQSQGQQSQGQQGESQQGSQAKDRAGRRGKGSRRAKGRRGGERPDMDRIFGYLDQNQDGAIEEDEAHERMKKRFANIDTNSDNRITKAELKTAFANRQGHRGGAGGKGKGKGGKGQRGEGGANGKSANGKGANGKGSKGKRKGKADGKTDRASDGGARGRRGQMMADPAKIFSSMDKNTDGEISRDEAPDRMKQRFDRLDADQSGRVSMDEFKTAIERMKARGKGGAAGRNKADAGKNKKAQKPKRPPMPAAGV